MPIHSYILKYLDEHAEERTDGIKQENPPEERRPAVHQIEDQLLELEGFQIPIRIYTPTPQEQYSLLVFFHEGRFMNGNLEASDVACRMIAQFSGHKLISVDYPIGANNVLEGFNQCYEATKRIIELAEVFNGKKDDLSIGGGSIGATIATLITIEAIKRKDFKPLKQILFYPITQFDEQIENSPYLSRKMYNGKYGIDLKNLKGLSETKLHSPLKTDAQILGQMPPTLIYTAEYDPFSDEAEEYAANMLSSGTNVKLVRFDGNIHGFMQSFPGSPDYMRGFELTTEFLANEEEEVFT